MNIRALQLGGVDYSTKYTLTKDVNWNYEPELSFDDKEYDICFVARELTEDEVAVLSRTVRAHCLFVLSHVEINEHMDFLMKSRLEAD